MVSGELSDRRANNSLENQKASKSKPESLRPVKTLARINDGRAREGKVRESLQKQIQHRYYNNNSNNIGHVQLSAFSTDAAAAEIVL